MKQTGKAVLNPGTVDEVWGLCDDFEVVPEADKEQVKNGDGDTVGLIFTDERTKYSGNYTPLVIEGADHPVTKDDLIGSELEVTLHGNKKVKIVVESASVKYKRGGVSTFAVEGYHYPKMQTTGA